MKSSRIYHPSMSCYYVIRLAWYSTLNYGLFDMIDVVWNVEKFKISSNHLLFYLSIPSLQNTSTEKS